MASDPPSGATTARSAAELVWVAADFDRPCETRRRGVRWRLRAGLFAWPVSAFAAVFAGLRGCLLAIVFVLWIRIAHRDACTTASPARGARRVATQEEAVDMDSNASYAGEVARKVGRDNDSLLRGRLLKNAAARCRAVRCVNPAKAPGSVGVSLLTLEQLRFEVAPTMLHPITYCRASLKARRRSVTAGA